MSVAEMPQCDSDRDAALDLARETVYRFLAALLSDPRGRHSWFSIDPVNLEAVRRAADLLRAELGERRVTLGLGELPAEDLDVRPLLAELEQPDGEVIDEYVAFRADHVSRMSALRDRVQHDRRHVLRFAANGRYCGVLSGLWPPAGGRCATSSADYLPLELEFVAFLLLKKRLAIAEGSADGLEHAKICEEARLAFFRDHLSWWVPSFSMALRRKAARGLYQEAGRVLAAFWPLERAVLEGRRPLLAGPATGTQRTSRGMRRLALR